MFKVLLVLMVVTSVVVLPALFLVLVLFESERNVSLKRRRDASDVLRDNGIYTQRQVDQVLRVLAVEHLERGSDGALEEFNRVSFAARCCGFKVKGSMD